MNSKDQLWIRSMEWCSKYCHCHQRADRSLFYHGYQLPLCARCTGIAIGHFTAFFIGFIHTFPLAIAFLMIPMAVDGTIQYFTKYESNNFKRVVTGLLYGFAFTSTLWHIIRILI